MPVTIMDFFAQQDKARKKTTLLIAYFGLAVVLTILLVYIIPVAGYYFLKVAPSTNPQSIPFVWWYPELFAVACGATLLVVLTGAMYKIAELRRGGGSGVAEMLGGKEVLPGTDDFFERRLRNVVEEMAIASGVPVPPVYLMEREMGLNAFAAGFTPSDSVVAVTYGTMTGLTREELQGVVAHEFSHILNNDMRMNISLMGIIHGLLIVGLTGRIILEFSFRGAAGRRSKNSGQIVVFAIAAGLALWIVGSCGMLFAKLIKSAISRSRERLADASAVQFTRNPAGLASALKKIGGLGAGSRIRAPRAEMASHMFFGNGLSSGLFSTHPPLPQRVQWLEPTFDGVFPAVTYANLREQLSRYEDAPKVQEKKKEGFVDLFTQPANLVIATAVIESIGDPTARPLSPHALMESIGRPMEHHADRARALIASIPETVRTYAYEPYGARMLIYFLLLDRDPDILRRQMAILKEMAEEEVFQTLEDALPKLGTLPPELQLPIVDLSIPALRFLSESQYRAFLQVVRALVEADDQVDLFEYALQRVLTHALEPTFSEKRKKGAANYYTLQGLAGETSALLSVLARKGHGFGADASTAFAAAVDVINEPKARFTILDREQCTWELLDQSLDTLNEGSAQLKKLILSAALTCLMHDRKITVEETELFRAIADTLDCPVPPWVTPAEVDG
jgi:Zn-dependent protease with chaperone function